jgi:DNA-binding response OmpR family regulator
MGERAVPRRELLTEVWGYNPAVTTHTLETHIYRLRRKIEVNPAKACLLVTEAGGYRLAVGADYPTPAAPVASASACEAVQ